jgi:putative membrane-bound dehydrogenase-like protein
MPRSLSLAASCLLLTATAFAQDHPLSPQAAPKAMTLPPGFQATLFAGEPDIVQPIAFTFDDRGRMWVVECLSYPNWTKEKEGHDRVVILEDTTGSGHFDKKTVFWDKGANLSGIEYGFGGIWLCSTPNLVFIPVRDDKPDGPPKILLDGWSLEAKHNVFNDLTWGPDGWLYGCNGILATSQIGKPGTPADKRVAMNCGVWRYHPTRQEFEVVAHGTTNPWGLDFDDYGQMFITNCVISHIWHVIPGAHYERMYGQDLNPNVYGLMKSTCDHIHWGGGDWTSSRGGKGAHDAPGGGHAHAGLMIYLGDAWPKEYRNGAFMCNLHGNRVNHDLLEQKGSGYVIKHGQDFLMANDPWFRGIAIHQGPQGEAYVADWCDTGECHNYDRVDRTNGRIYRLSYGPVKPFGQDLQKLTDVELAKLQLSPNEWLVRHARRILQERAAAGGIATPGGVDPKAVHELWRILDGEPDRNGKPEATQQLRALWTLYCTGKLRETDYLNLMRYAKSAIFEYFKNEERNGEYLQLAVYIRSWAVRLGLDGAAASERTRNRLRQMALGDEGSDVVILEIASSLHRLPIDQRLEIVGALASHSNSGDPYLQLLTWYALEPAVPNHRKLAGEFTVRAGDPLIREYTARRLASIPGKVDSVTTEQLQLLDLLDVSPKSEVQRDILQGIQAAWLGRHTVPMPLVWVALGPKLAASDSTEVRERSLALGLIFDDPQAFTTLRETAANTRKDAYSRRKALEILIQKPNAELRELLDQLLADAAMRGPAIRALAFFQDDALPAKLLKLYPALTEAEKADVVQTLSSRPSYALALLDAIDKNQVPRRDVSPFIARQIVNLKSQQVSERLAKVWGVIQPASKERAALTAKYKSLLTPEFMKKADLAQGRLVFEKNCATCHKLFDHGASIGPELTGSQRHNLDYVLENVLDPSAVVAKEYQVTIIELKNGRTLNGLVQQETASGLVLQTPNERIVISKDDIESRRQTITSMMPEGIFDKLTNEEIRDLVAYLGSPKQVPLPK